MKKIQLSVSKKFSINSLIINDAGEFIFDIEGESFFYYFTPLTFMPAKDNFLFLKGSIINQLAGELFHFKSGNTEFFFNLFFQENVEDNFIINGFVNEYIQQNCSLKKNDVNQDLYNNNFDLFPLKVHSCSATLNSFKSYSSYTNFFPEHLKINKINDIYSFIDEDFIPVFKSKIEFLTKKNIPLDVVYKLKTSNNESAWYRTILKAIPELNCFYGGTIQVDKKTVDDYNNRIINKVFQKTEYFYKSGHWYFDLSTNSISISKTLKVILNTSNNNLFYNEFLNLFINEKDSNYFKTIFKNCTSNGADFEIELSFENSDKNIRWYKISGYADTINSKIIGVFGTISDISEEKKHTLLLRESQKQFETILSHNLQGYILLDKSQTIISYNEIIYQSSLKYFKAKLEKSKHVLDCFKKIDKEDFYATFEKCLNGEIIHSETSFIENKTNKKYFKTSYVPVFETKNIVSKVLIVVTDVTDFKFRELELKELSIVASSISSGVYIVGKNHKIKWANQSYEKLIQLELSSIINKTPLILNHLYTNKKNVSEIEQSILANKSFRNEVNIRRKNGTNYWAMITITPLFDDNNELIQYIVVEDDITDIKNAEAYKIFIDNQKKIREIREQKIRTLSVLSGQETERMKFSKDLHEGIGQSLTAAKFELSSIKKYSDEKAFHDKILSFDRNLKEVIDRIRAISKDLSPSTLYDFGLEAAIEELIAKHKKNYLQIDFVFTSNLKKLRLGIVYEVELFRMLAEIILNALTHSKCDSILIDMSVYKNEINISVADNGLGFEKDKIKFNTKGLKNIKERARLLGAKVNYVTRIGKGSVFSIDLSFNKD